MNWYDDYFTDSSAEAYKQHAELERIRNTCIIMARVMTWVWCEARVVELCDSDWRLGSDVARYCALHSAIERGLLRLDWGGGR